MSKTNGCCRHIGRVERQGDVREECQDGRLWRAMLTIIKTLGCILFQIRNYCIILCREVTQPNSGLSGITLATEMGQESSRDSG